MPFVPQERVPNHLNPVDIQLISGPERGRDEV
jgi:hypothetical protein